MAWNSRAYLHLFQKIITLCLLCICHLVASTDFFWFLAWKPANIHSAVTFFLAHNFKRHLLYTLCHLFVSLEESYSILSFLTGKLLYNSRSYPSLFPEPCHAILFVSNIPHAMCGGYVFWYNDIFYHVVSSFVSNHVFASFYHYWAQSWWFNETSIPPVVP